MITRGETRQLPDGTYEKRCTKCGAWKPATREHFAPNKYGALGLRPDCKPCVAVMSRHYHETHKAQNREYRRKCYQANPERERELARMYHEKNHPPSTRALELRELRAKGLRRCCDCQRILPATEEYFPKCSSQPLKLHYRCHECNRINARKQWQRRAADGGDR